MKHLKSLLTQMILDNQDRFIDVEHCVERTVAILQNNGSVLAAATELLQDFPDDAWVDTFYEEVVEFLEGEQAIAAYTCA